MPPYYEVEVQANNFISQKNELFKSESVLRYLGSMDDAAEVRPGQEETNEEEDFS